MSNVLLDLLQTNTGALTTLDILVNFLLAGVLGIVVFLSYRISFAGVVYSARFNMSLIMLTLVTTLVMNVIGNNIALSLGMVGALSIVRFRTAIKDPRDTTYIFWCIAIGICCGVQEYTIASIGSGVIFLFMLIFGAVKSNNRFLLIVRGDVSCETEVNRTIGKPFYNKATVRVRNVTPDMMEYIFEVTERTVTRAESEYGSVSALLVNLDGVTDVSLVNQNDEINR
jgi:uncharacterized membrane protein YhiD involved in acid resistance